jgi:sterol desaturase/sphingolipid hydroxylase (fatty acid hydroxylase superfamily)
VLNAARSSQRAQWPALVKKSPVAPFVGGLCLSALFLGALYFGTLLKLAPVKQTLGWAAAYTLIGIAPPLVLSLLEHLTSPAGPRKSGKKWLVHFQIMLANYASGIPFALLATYLASMLVKALGLNLGLLDLRIGDGQTVLSIIAAVILAGLVGDFFFYWYHRALHKSSILWQHHKMHHLDPEFDALTGPRQNWLENFFIVFFISVPVAVLFRLNATDLLGAGFVQGAIIGFWTLLNFQNHSNLRLQFGKATVFLTSSQSHRIHHSYLPQHRDKNFVGFFPIWDILFGTYYHPARDEFPLTGVEGENDIQSVWEVQIFALREWRKMFLAHRKNRAVDRLKHNGD